MTMYDPCDPQHLDHQHRFRIDQARHDCAERVQLRDLASLDNWTPMTALHCRIESLLLTARTIYGDGAAVAVRGPEQTDDCAGWSYGLRMVPPGWPTLADEFVYRGACVGAD